MQKDVVKTLTMRARQEGVKELRADLEGVAGAQQKVAQSAGPMAVATDNSAKKMVSAGGAYERLMEKMDRMLFLERQQAKETMIVQRAFDQGRISTAQRDQATGMLAENTGV